MERKDDRPGNTADPSTDSAFRRGSVQANSLARQGDSASDKAVAGQSGGQAGQSLRRRAEEMPREKAAQSPEDFDALSPEEARRALHELRVHQIELEMQNEELRRAQIELEAARERYFDLYDLAPVGYCTVSEEGLILEANLAAATLLGLPRNAMVKHPLANFILPEDQDIYYLHRKQLLETGVPLACELRMACQGGKVFWARLAMSAAQGVEGSPVCRVVIIDITTRKQAEGELQESEGQLRFESLLAELSARFVNLPADQVDIEIGEAQRRICEFLSLDLSALWQWSNEVQGSFMLTHLHRALEGPPPPERMDASEHFPWCQQQLLAGRIITVSSLEGLPAEAARDRETWRHFGIKTTLTIPLSVGGGPPIGALSFNSMRAERDWPDALVKRLQLVAQVFANALARMHTELTLRESEARYRGIFDGALEGIFRTTLQGTITVANPALAKMLGYGSAEDVVREVVDSGRQVWADPEERSRFVRLLEEHETVRAFECQFMRKDGTKIWVSLNSRAVRGPDGRMVYNEGFVEDITHRKQAEESLHAAYAEIKALKDRIEAENRYLRSEIRTVAGYDEIIGQSEAIRRVVGQAEQVAPTDSTVLIQGQTGTGKELLAHVIHTRSPRSGNLFVTVNLASLPSSLLEGELFGREKGAYTGALTRQTGRFEVADGGTVFLDEIGEMPLETQAKLLRVLQQGEFERLGSNRTLKVNVRIIAATNRDLASAVRSGQFREDLYYRLNVFPIHMPLLCERREDIPLMVWSFVREFGERMGKRIERISHRTMEGLQAYSWPGNVRELRNVVERSMILTAGTDLQAELPEVPQARTSSSQALAEADRHHILSVLEMTGWRVRGKGGAAERLGLKPSTLESKMKKLGIRRTP